MQHSGATQDSIKIHDKEIQENLWHWNRKPCLRKQYARFYKEIASQLHDVSNGPILECGSGIGNIKSVIPEAITSDLFSNPWLDRRENVYCLSFENESIAAVVLFDVFHHLQYPGAALMEIQRVLKPKGRLVIFEPAMGLLGRIALGLFHHEPLGLREPITWLPQQPFDPANMPYYAAQGNAWRIFAGKDDTLISKNWKCISPKYYPALPWLVSGGFRGPTILPNLLGPCAQAAESILNLAPRIFASRMLISLEKAD